MVSIIPSSFLVPASRFGRVSNEKEMIEISMSACTKISKVRPALVSLLSTIACRFICKCLHLFIEAALKKHAKGQVHNQAFWF